MHRQLAAWFEIQHSGNAKISTMEGLRGFAVFLVFLVHYGGLCGPYLGDHGLTASTAAHLAAIGHAGVDLFFVLSGFLIYGLLLKREQGYLPYLRRRVQRIYPVFTVVFLVYLGLSFAVAQESKLPADPYEAAVWLMQNFLLMPGIFDIRPMITVAWSLSYEFAFYLAIPPLIGLLRLRRWRPGWRVGLLGLAAIGGYTAHGISGDGHVRLLMFVAGMLLHEVVADGRWRAPRHAGAIVLVLLLPILALLDPLAPGHGLRYPALFVLATILCWECFTVDGLTSRAFTWAPLRWLGNMSYSYYLIHGLTLKAVFLVLLKLLPPDGGQAWLYWLLFLPAFAGTLVASAVLFLLVEKPFSLTRTEGRPAGHPPA